MRRLLIICGLVACRGDATTSPQPPDPPPPGTYRLALHTHNDDSAIVAWRDAINADSTHDTVRAIIPKGSVHMHIGGNDPIHPGYIQIWNPGARPNRVVDISGESRDSSILYVDSSAHSPGGVWGAFGFVVLDSHVHLHRMTIVSLADSTQTPPEDGNSDEGIRFDGRYGAQYGEIDSVTVKGFRLTGIDVFVMKGVHVHDNDVLCLTSNDATHQQQTMGIWMRELQPPTPPGMPMGIIDHNAIWNCGADYVDVARSQFVDVQYNTIDCFAPDCPNGSFVLPIRPIVGISLYSTPDDGQPCTEAKPVSNNHVAHNTVHGHGWLSGGIVIQGTGTGHRNRIDSNTVSGLQFRGLSDNPSPCPAGVANGAFSGNLYRDNTVLHVLNTTGNDYIETWDIFAEGQNDTVVFNFVCTSDPAKIGADPGLTWYSADNFAVPCRAASSPATKTQPSRPPRGLISPASVPVSAAHPIRGLPLTASTSARAGLVTTR